MIFLPEKKRWLCKTINLSDTGPGVPKVFTVIWGTCNIPSQAVNHPPQAESGCTLLRAFHSAWSLKCYLWFVKQIKVFNETFMNEILYPKCFFWRQSCRNISLFSLGKNNLNWFQHLKAKGALYLLHLWFTYLQLFYCICPTSFLCLPGKASLLQMHPTPSAPS